MYNLTPIVKNILIINIGLYLLDSFSDLDLARIFGVHYIFSDGFYIFQYITYMWLHAGFYHLLGNMFAVFIFGPNLEKIWGSKRFLIFYLITGIGAGLLFGIADTIEKRDLRTKTKTYIYNPNPEDFYIYIHEYKSRSYDLAALGNFADKYYEDSDNQNYIEKTRLIIQQIYDDLSNTPMIGASGAVFGILMAFGMMFPNTELLLLFPPIPIKAKYLVFFYGVFELYSEINRSIEDNVAHLAHIGGMLIAFIMLKYWQNKNSNFY